MRVPHIRSSVFIFFMPQHKANQGHGSSGQAPMQCISAPRPSAAGSCANRRSSTVSTGLSTVLQSISPGKSACFPYCPQFPQIIHKHPPQPRPMWKSRPSCPKMSSCSVLIPGHPSRVVCLCIFMNSVTASHCPRRCEKRTDFASPSKKTPRPSPHVHMTIIFRGYTEASP